MTQTLGYWLGGLTLGWVTWPVPYYVVQWLKRRVNK